LQRTEGHQADRFHILCDLADQGVDVGFQSQVGAQPVAGQQAIQEAVGGAVGGRPVDLNRARAPCRVNGVEGSRACRAGTEEAGQLGERHALDGSDRRVADHSQGVVAERHLDPFNTALGAGFFFRAGDGPGGIGEVDLAGAETLKAGARPGDFQADLNTGGGADRLHNVGHDARAVDADGGILRQHCQRGEGDHNNQQAQVSLTPEQRHSSLLHEVRGEEAISRWMMAKNAKPQHIVHAQNQLSTGNPAAVACRDQPPGLRTYCSNASAVQGRAGLKKCS